MRLTPEAMRLMYFINQQHCTPLAKSKCFISFSDTELFGS